VLCSGIASLKATPEHEGLDSSTTQVKVENLLSNHLKIAMMMAEYYGSCLQEGILLLTTTVDNQPCS
jgi:hypothetical protein